MGQGQAKDSEPQRVPVAASSQSTLSPNTAAARTVDAIQKLGETEGLLLKRRAVLEKKVAAELEKAKAFSKSKNQKAALLALKKKKMYEQQIQQVENNILRVNEEEIMLEDTRTQMETLAALKTAAHAAKEQRTELNIEGVDTVIDEINEQADYMRMVQDALANPLGSAADLDEDELLNELEELEAEALDDDLLAPAPVPATELPPKVPVATKPAPQKTPEEVELEALQAEMT